ncbi:hypothetical protein M4578_08455 [Salipiger sp. P9]|uniref:hypothetical protein n=1 Tax=Salipiger pentaromativorans TaxID=2943193 RepID=UPI002157F520|nr:hypothetical protein [Salipiger pentaromativorans]MCR8547856.1 hypothetical protein [Salipiger pentaromativorans]
MTRRIPPTVRQVDAALSLLDKRAVILAYQAYQLEMHGVPIEIFGEDFDAHLDASLKNGDRMKVLSQGTRDVLLAMRDVARDGSDEWPVFRDSFAAALPGDVFTRIMDMFEPD